VKAANTEGCIDLNPIAVVVDTVPVITVTDPPPSYYPNVVDITAPAVVSTVSTGLLFSYWKDAAATVPIADPRAINVAGIYYIRATTRYGCTGNGACNCVYADTATA
jgi:hypothetical protein